MRNNREMNKSQLIIDNKARDDMDYNKDDLRAKSVD